MDGVIFKDVNFWMELHKRFGTYEQGKILTEKYLHSDYDKLVEEVVGKLWKGKDAKPYYDLVDSYQYLEGVKEIFDFVHKRGYKSAIISGSSIEVAKRVQKDYSVDYIFANELIIEDNKVSGEFKWPIGAGKHLKAKIISELCQKLDISPKETIYVGDTELDIEAFQIVGKSIAFNSESEALKKTATHVVDSQNLSDIIKYL